MKGLFGGLFKKKPKQKPIEIKVEKQLKQVKDVRFVKVWSTALDDCVCQECAKLEGVSVPMNGKFTIDGKKISGPPLHDGCRCALMYEEE